MSAPESRPSRFPQHSSPRVWFLTSTTCPTAITLAQQVLAHGDCVAAGLRTGDFDIKQPGDDRSAEFCGLLREVGEKEEWKGRFRVIGLDVRTMGQCQAAIAEAVEVFGRVDILFCCTSESVVGTVEELSQSSRTMTLVRDQFETNFFGPVNIVKAALPTLRAQRSGHIMILTGITGHLGTPGLGMYCASGWALEGFCDSLAYEIAPFNIKMTIVQPNMETNILTNKVTFAPSLPQYSAENNTAPLSRGILSNLLTRLESSKGTVSREISSILNNTEVVSLYPPLPRDFKASLVAETIHALTAIGGYDNPPARHIVGHEGVASVKEKLKTVSEELEDFVEVSGAVDIIKEEDGSPNVDGVMGSED